MSDTPLPDPDSFEDPLENYDPKRISDPLEEALATEPASAIQTTPYASVPPDTPISKAVKELGERQVACLLIEQDRKLLGVFSDRDVLDKVALEYEQVQDEPVSSVMTKSPIYVYDSDSSAAVLTVMAVHGFRHVPVLDTNEKIVGIVSPYRITSFLQSYFEKS